MLFWISLEREGTNCWLICYTYNEVLTVDISKMMTCYNVGSSNSSY